MVFISLIFKKISGRKGCYAKNVYLKITKILSPLLLKFFVVIVHKNLVINISHVSVDSLDCLLLRFIPLWKHVNSGSQNWSWWLGSILPWPAAQAFSRSHREASQLRPASHFRDATRSIWTAGAFSRDYDWFWLKEWFSEYEFTCNELLNLMFCCFYCRCVKGA